MDEFRKHLAGALRQWLEETAASAESPLVMTITRDEVVKLMTILDINTRTEADIDSMWALIEGCREANRILREKLRAEEVKNDFRG